MPIEKLAAPVHDVPADDVRDPALFKIRDLIYRMSGIFQTDNKFYLLANRCQRRMNVIKSSSFSDYLDQLTIRPNRDAEMRALLNEITIGETCFFRNQPQLDAVTKVVLPKLASLKSKQMFKKIRVWSAGCSTGEEPYTLSIVFLEQLAHKVKGWSIEIVATDLNDNSLAKCRDGVYSDYALRNTTREFRDRYFTPEEQLFRVRDEVRELIKFERLNLQDQAKILFMKGFDIIFCCNVLIYFDGASKRRTIEHFYNALLPSGYFFLGHSESLYGIEDRLRLVHFPNATAYYKTNPGELGGDAQ